MEWPETNELANQNVPTSVRSDQDLLDDFAATQSEEVFSQLAEWNGPAASCRNCAR